MGRPAVTPCLLLLVVAGAVWTAAECDDVTGAAGHDLAAGSASFTSGRLLQASAAPPQVLVKGSIDAKETGRAIPASYAGHSIEWDNPRTHSLSAADKVHVGKLGSKYSFSRLVDTPLYIPLLKLLANGNANGPFVIRMGGNSEDLVETFRKATLETLAKLRQQLGAKFIVGLNFLQERTPRLAVAQVKQVQQYLPASSVISWEIGNEPDHYFEQADFKTYLSGWAPVRDALTPLVGNKLAGPAWDTPNVPQANLTAFLKSNAKALNLVTVHYYVNGANVPGANYRQILSERSVANTVTKGAPTLAAAKKYKRPVRLAELNSFYSGGLKGGSDVFAASLWALDLMLTTANAGYVGTDFHGFEKTSYNSLQRTRLANGKYTTVAKPVFYGQWAFQKAVAGGASIVPVRTSRRTENVKVWALRLRSGSVRLRLVFINKTATPGAVTLTIRGLRAGASGKVYALTAPSITSTAAVRFGGISAEAATGGSRMKAAATVRGVKSSSGSLQYTFQVPAYWAAVVSFA